MEKPTKAQKLYYMFLRFTRAYNYYNYYFESYQTIAELDRENAKLYNEYLQEFHFLNFYPKDCLTLAYQDKAEEITVKIKSKKP